MLAFRLIVLNEHALAKTRTADSEETASLQAIH